MYRYSLRSAAVLGLITVCGTLALLRHHVRDLIEVARTYSTFYPYLEHHPETLYRYQSTESSSHQGDNSTLVPQILHQVFLTEGLPSTLSKYRGAVESCHALHPDWEQNIWTDDAANEFIATHYPNLLPHYIGYKQRIQRANILRYALLDHFGGVYLDLDITCLHPLDSLRNLPFVSPGAYPAGVNNAFILSRPGHPFLKHLLAGVKSRDLGWGMPYVENMLSTGCMFFSNRWMSYVRSLSAKSTHATEGEMVYILADQEGGIDSQMLRGKIVTPLFEHGGASSWHGWDAAMIVMIGKYYRLFALMVVASVVLTVLGIWRLRVSGTGRRRRSWHTLMRASMEKPDDREALAGRKEG